MVWVIAEQCNHRCGELFVPICNLTSQLEGRRRREKTTLRIGQASRCHHCCTSQMTEVGVGSYHREVSVRVPQRCLGLMGIIICYVELWVKTWDRCRQMSGWNTFDWAADEYHLFGSFVVHITDLGANFLRGLFSCLIKRQLIQFSIKYLLHV